MSKLVKTEIGLLPKNWSVVTLGEIADVIDPHPSHRAPKVVDNGYPFAGIGDVDEYGNIRVKKARQISEEFVLQQERSYEINEYSIGYGRVGTVGKVVKLRKQEYRYALSPTLAVINPKNNVNPRFVYCLVRTKNFYHQVLNHMTGTTRPAIGIQLLRKIKVPLPSPEEQNQIAESICSLDDKIEINTKTNQILEQISQAIFKSWFVNFDPVKAKIAAKQAGSNAQQIERAAMAAISGKTETELDQLTPEQYQNLKTTAALFPDELVDSELGEIPLGWEVKLNGDLMDVRDGTHDSPKQSEKGYPLVTSRHITTGELNIKDAYLISEEDFNNVNKRSNVEQGDILLTMIGTVGIPYLVMQPEVNFAIKNIGLFRTSETRVLRNYFYLLLKSKGMQQYLEARMAGTTQKYLSLKTLRTIEMISPTHEVLSTFNNVVSPLLNKIFDGLEENASMSEIRDSLLPKLLSGEITTDSFPRSRVGMQT